ncbi:hypothetical protein ACFTZM_29215 [Streptomyces hydrogenans]|uniref:hypothetical protein n=1 Tax=Streptomyces hydrogenans TaxID=1873719 RepID=UPI00362617B3
MKVFKKLTSGAITGALSVLLFISAVTPGGASAVLADPNWDSAPAHPVTVGGSAIL